MEIESKPQKVVKSIMKKPKILTSRPPSKLRGAKSLKEKSMEEEICNKIEFLIGGFNFVNKHTKDLPVITSQRGFDILLKLCRQGFRDYEIRKKVRDKELQSQTEGDPAQLNKDANEEMLLGKRENSALNIERSLDVRKLLKAENKELEFIEDDSNIPSVVNEMGNSQKRLETVIRVSKFRTKFLRKNIKINQKAKEEKQNEGRMVEEGQEESEEFINPIVLKEKEEMENEEKLLLEHHLNIIECIFSSTIEIPVKLNLILDYICEEFLEEGKLYCRFLSKRAFELIEEMEFSTEADLQAWENFINRLPDNSVEYVEHIYKLSKKYRSISILPQISEFLPEKTKVEAIKMIMKLGTAKILKKAEKIYSETEYFDTVMAPESIRIFCKLKENAEKYESAQSEKIKRLISPLFMCLLHKTELFEELIKDYHKLANPAKMFIIEKFTTILKNVLKSNQIAGLYFEVLIVQREESDQPEDYQALIESFKHYVKIQGGKVHGIFSDAIVNYVIKSHNLKVLAEFKEEMIKEKVIKILLHFFEQEDFDYKQIEEVMEVSGMTDYEILIELVFYSEQNNETLPKLAAIQQTLMQNIDVSEYSKPEFRQKMLLRLNKILPNAQLLRKETKPVPALFFPFLLRIILKLHTQAQAPKPWENFFELIKLLIKANKQTEPMVWEGLMRYAKFDRYFAEMKIAPLLNIDEREKLFNQAF